MDTGIELSYFIDLWKETWKERRDMEREIPPKKKKKGICLSTVL